MTNLVAVALLVFVILIGPRTVMAAGPSLLLARYPDPVKQLEAEVEMAWSYYSELTRCIIKHARKRYEPEEIEKAEKKAHAEMRDDLDREIAKSGGNPAPALEQTRDALIYTINETAINAAERFRLSEPKLVTTESLRAAIEDEKSRIVPICVDTPSFPLAAISPQTSVAHLEDCIEWGYRNGHYGAVNDCRESSSIQFMLINDERVIKGEVEPGAFFDTGLTGNQVSSSRLLFTACPVGYVPSVPFSLKYQDEIRESRYSCLRK